MARDSSSRIDVRIAALRAVLALTPHAYLASAAALLNDGSLPIDHRDEIGRALADLNMPEAGRVLSEALRLAPFRLQLKLAQAICGNPEGADALIGLVKDGRIPAQLL